MNRSCLIGPINSWRIHRTITPGKSYTFQQDIKCTHDIQYLAGQHKRLYPHSNQYPDRRSESSLEHPNQPGDHSHQCKGKHYYKTSSSFFEVDFIPKPTLICQSKPCYKTMFSFLYCTPFNSNASILFIASYDAQEQNLCFPRLNLVFKTQGILF